MAKKAKKSKVHGNTGRVMSAATKKRISLAMRAASKKRKRAKKTKKTPARKPRRSEPAGVAA